MIKTKCPASCGELFQGYMDGKSSLISYPIDIFSTVTLKEGISKEKTYPKAYEGVKKTLEYFGYNSSLYKDINLNINSDIPIAKGMASSTADLAATILATSKYMGKNISEEEIGKIAVKVEPTDSSIFKDITLFDYLNGNLIKKYNAKLNLKVLCLEGRGIIDTINFNKLSSNTSKRKNEAKYKKAFAFVEKGLKENDMKILAKGSSLSAFINQKLLFKDDLDKIYTLSIKCKAYGINTAHSGTVTGILYDEKIFDKEKFLYEFKNIASFNEYKRSKEYKIINGGPRLLEE